MVSRRGVVAVLVGLVVAFGALAQEVISQETPKRIDATPTRSAKTPKAKKKSRIDTTPTRGLTMAPAAPADEPRESTSAGPIRLAVDATDAPRRVLHARLAFPATAGPLALYYPKWLPGDHGPTGPINQIAGLRFSVAGVDVPWRRDPVDLYAILLDVPQGASSLDVAFDYLMPSDTGDVSASAAATAQLAVLSWNTVLLYPRGAASDDVMYAPSLKLPAGWKHGSSLRVTDERDGAVTFAPVSLTTLVDAPVLMGARFRSIPLSAPGASPTVVLDMAGESDASLAIKPETLQGYKNLVAETEALFGAHHYSSYHFLLALSDGITHFGLEHHESSDNRVAERALVDESEYRLFLSLLPHEYVHSWNGKYRRPVGLATGNYHDPMVGELLWVYEGLTEYLGAVLTARSGLQSVADFREDLASVAARLDTKSGRRWRPNQDTATAASLLYVAPGQWANYRRGVDFYDEGILLWLDVDVTIRRLTNGARSIEDFCRAFHGAPTTGPALRPYTFEDVVTALGAVVPNDWASFLRSRLDSKDARASLGGITGGGWRLSYSDQPNGYDRAYESANKRIRLDYSLGLLLGDDGTVADATIGGPAFTAGIAPGMKIIGVNGSRFTAERLRDALDAAKASTSPIEFLVENAERFSTVRISYDGGYRGPHLERDAAHPDVLTTIAKPIAPAR